VAGGLASDRRDDPTGRAGEATDVTWKWSWPCVIHVRAGTAGRPVGWSTRSIAQSSIQGRPDTETLAILLMAMTMRHRKIVLRGMTIGAGRILGP